MAGVHVQGLTIRYGGQAVIERLDLEVADGEFLVLLGPSGCGKSTLLHGIAGLVDVHGGTVSIGGRDMTAAAPDARGIGMVFQSYALYPTMTVEGNLSFGLRVAGLPKPEIARRVGQAAQLLQLDGLLGRKPAQLSGGQRQRVAIGRALVREAGVFLFDEPLSNLDAQLRAELRREIKRLHLQLGSTMVYVTHDQAEAMTLATRIVVMRQGRVQQVGAPSEVYERPQNLFVAGFLGSPPMNVVHGRLQAGADGPRFESPALALDLAPYAFRTPPAAGADVVLGLRPEQLRLAAGGAHAARVQLVEPMGSHHVLWLDPGGGAAPLAALLHEGAAPRAGEPVRFDIDAARAALFDRASEARL